MDRLYGILIAGLIAIGPAKANATNADLGAAVFKKCAACHQVGREAKNRVGPHLNDLFGRVAGSLPEMRFSPAMTAKGAEGLIWDLETLDVFLADPKSYVKGTRMSFRGLNDAEDRSHLLAYLRTFSDNPRDIPEALPTVIGTDHDLDPAILALEGDAEYGEYLASECLTCHRADGTDGGIPSITGWQTEAFVIAMHSYKSKKRPHPVMQMMAGRLNEEEIAALAAYFNSLN